MNVYTMIHVRRTPVHAAHLRYLLTECVDDGKYNAVECDEQWYLLNRFSGTTGVMHGPASLIANSSPFFAVDDVHCVRCLSWPSQAADWPTRQRIHGWPDSTTVSHVVSNGCDVVPVAHRRCRLDEWMSVRQHRICLLYTSPSPRDS